MNNSQQKNESKKKAKRKEDLSHVRMANALYREQNPAHQVFVFLNDALSVDLKQRGGNFGVKDKHSVSEKQQMADGSSKAALKPQRCQQAYVSKKKKWASDDSEGVTVYLVFLTTP